MGTLDMWNAISGKYNNGPIVLDTLAKAREYAGYACVQLLKVNDER